MMKTAFQFIKKRKYVLMLLVFAFILFNLYYMSYKIENFESQNNGLIKTDVLVEKLRNKIDSYDKIIQKMKTIQSEITNS